MGLAIPGERQGTAFFFSRIVAGTRGGKQWSGQHRHERVTGSRTIIPHKTHGKNSAHTEPNFRNQFSPQRGRGGEVTHKETGNTLEIFCPDLFLMDASLYVFSFLCSLSPHSGEKHTVLSRMIRKFCTQY